jgi:hypothetical protein
MCRPVWAQWWQPQPWRDTPRRIRRENNRKNNNNNHAAKPCTSEPSPPHPPSPKPCGVGFVGPSTPFPLREVSKNIRKSEKEKGDVVQCSYIMIPEIQVLGRVCQVTSDPCLSIQCLFLFQGKTEMPTLAHY